ncbi:hypothetical protein V5799_004464, partial [Amblyomma americanum]
MAVLNIGIVISLIALAIAVPPANRLSEGTDNLRVFTAFPNAVAAFTSSNDTVFKCSTATRTHFNPQAGTVTYVWHFKAHSGHRQRDVVFNIKFGDAPGRGIWNVDNDTAHNYTAYYEYSDYETCVVMKFTFEGHEHTAHSYTGSYEYSDYATCAVIAFPFEGQQ